MHDDVTTDRALVAQLLAGDQQAFDAFFDTMFPRVYRFALVRVADREDVAEDIAQTTLCRAVRKLATWRGEAQLFTWICAICRRVVEEWQRSEEQSAAVALVEDDPEVRAALESAGDPWALDRSVQASQVGALVRRLLDYLPHHYASVLQWKYLDDATVRTIAERMGTSEKAAESLLTRARLAFKDLVVAVAPHLAPADLGIRRKLT